MTSAIFNTEIMPMSDKMFRYAKSIVKDEHTAADVTQDCLLKIWEKRKILSGVNNRPAWAMRIVRNQCYDWVRMNRFTIQVEEREDISGGPTTDKQLIQADHLSWLKEILDTLSVKQQEIFFLREIEELPYQDIAEILDLSLADVKVSLHRTRQLIREKMIKIENYGVVNQ